MNGIILFNNFFNQDYFQLFLLQSVMKFIQQILRSASKTQNPNAKNSLTPKISHSTKLINHPKSQTLSQENDWFHESVDSCKYFEKIIEIKLGKTDIIPKNKNDKSHMIYQICILTSDFQYTIKKRFSLFNEFYVQVRKQIGHLSLQFPKKTLLVSGTNIEVVTQRYELLNAFIRKIFKEAKQQKNKLLQIKLNSFLSIRQQYSRRKVKSYSELPKDPNGQSQEFSVEETSISFQLRKLNDYDNHQQDIISKIQRYIQYKNTRITNDQIKTLLVGNSCIQLKGLLNLSLSTCNQIKALQLMRFLLDYISPQKKSYNDKIFKQFEKLPLQSFHFDYQKIKNNFSIVQFKQVFFIILELYCQNKIFKELKVIQRYPLLVKQFQVWKNLYELNEGNLIKKISTSNINSNIEILLKKPSNYQQKAKSFQITPKICETRPGNLFPSVRSAQNLDILISLTDQKLRKSSFRSNNSTSQLTIQQDWETCKMKLQLGDLQDPIFEDRMQVQTISDIYTVKSNKLNKLFIQLNKTSLSISQCQSRFQTWNKLIYDQRHDPFTQISRIYMKLNGKCKIFKFKQQDERVQKKNQNFLRIAKRRLQSHNSIGKSGKQNVQDLLKLKSNENFNGFEEIITIENIFEQKQTGQGDMIFSQIETFRKITIELNFEGQEDYFKTQISGKTCYLLDYAVQAFIK